MRFCDSCGKRLIEILTAESILFKCNTCNAEYKALPEDTLLYKKQNVESNDTKYITYIKDMEHDHCGNRDFSYCSKCETQRLFVWMYTANDMKMIYKCLTCKNVFVNKKDPIDEKVN
jgi:DNA-directed RNA polymerase subunit M/transcription elongation factor TFIIS